MIPEAPRCRALRGSCLCGQVKYELEGRVDFINHCHCSMCRKAHGAAFGTFAHADGRGFRWTQGENGVQRYPSSPGNVRAFCRTCGSNLPVLEDNGAHVILPAGTLDDDPEVEPCVHIHVDSKAPWYDISDSLPQFGGFPPEEFWARAEDHHRHPEDEAPRDPLSREEHDCP